MKNRLSITRSAPPPAINGPGAPFGVSVEVSRAGKILERQLVGDPQNATVMTGVGRKHGGRGEPNGDSLDWVLRPDF